MLKDIFTASSISFADKCVCSAQSLSISSDLVIVSLFELLLLNYSQ